MSLVLYYSPGACSLAAHAVLFEMGVPFEARRVVIANGELRQESYLALNPRGRVPVLLIDGRPVRELSGILTWLGQQCGLTPPAGSYEAALCGEWLAWLTSSVHAIAFGLLLRGERYIDDERFRPMLRDRGFVWLNEQFDEIERALAKAPFVLGESYSVVDYNLLPFYRWGSRVGYDMRRAFPVWTAHAQRLLERPAVARAFEAEGIDLFADAYDGFPPRPSK